MTPSANCVKHKDGILIWYLRQPFACGFACVFVVLPSVSVYMETATHSLCVALVMGGRAFVQLAYSTTICLLASMHVSQWPDAVESQRAQTGAWEGLISKLFRHPFLSLSLLQCWRIAPAVAFSPFLLPPLCASLNHLVNILCRRFGSGARRFFEPGQPRDPRCDIIIQVKNNARREEECGEINPKTAPAKTAHEPPTRASFSKGARMCAHSEAEGKKEGRIAKLAVWMMFSRSSGQMNETENPLFSWVLLLRALWHRTITERRMSPHYSVTHTHTHTRIASTSYKE